MITLGCVAKQHETVANSVAEQREGVAKPVAQQRLIAQVEELRKQGVSFRDIARRLNAENTPTPSGKGQWHGANVARLVNSKGRTEQDLPF